MSALRRRLLRLASRQREAQSFAVILIDPTEQEVRAYLEQGRSVISLPDNHRDRPCAAPSAA